MHPCTPSLLGASPLVARVCCASLTWLPRALAPDFAPKQVSPPGDTMAWHAGHIMREFDMLGLGPDGKPDPNYNATGSGVTPATTAYDPSQPPHQMELTQREQDILDGKRGEVLAKVMRTVVDHGNLFGATKLVDLGGAGHSALFTGTPAMAPGRGLRPTGLPLPVGRTGRPCASPTAARGYAPNPGT